MISKLNWTVLNYLRTPSRPPVGGSALVCKTQTLKNERGVEVYLMTETT